MFKNQLAVGLVLLAIVLCAMIVVVASRGVTIDIRMDARSLMPSAQSPLGTDDLGRDLLSCLVYGAAVSLGIGVVVVFLSASLGLILGLVSGLAGGIVDTVIMRLVDIVMAFPGILLAVALAAFVQPGVVGLVMILSVSSWVEYARLVRGEVLRCKSSRFILAARGYNASFFRILVHHLLPLVLPVLLVQASLGISGVILSESSLHFLGLGLGRLEPTLGQLIETGVGRMFEDSLAVLAPGLLLFIMVIAFNFIGEGLRNRLVH